MHKYTFWYAPKCFEHNLKEDDDKDDEHKNKQSNDLTPTASLATKAAELFVGMEKTLQLLKNAEQLLLALSTDAGVDN